METLTDLIAQAREAAQPVPFEIPEWNLHGFVREPTIESLSGIVNAREPSLRALRLLEGALVDDGGARLIDGNAASAILCSGAGPFGPATVVAIARRAVDALGLEIDLDAGPA